MWLMDVPVCRRKQGPRNGVADSHGRRTGLAVGARRLLEVSQRSVDASHTTVSTPAHRSETPCPAVRAWVRNTVPVLSEMLLFSVARNVTASVPFHAFRTYGVFAQFDTMFSQAS